MAGRRRTSWTIVLVILVFLSILYFRSNRFVADDEPASYTVTLLAENPDRAQVEAEFTLEDTLLFTTHEGPDPKAYAPFVRGLQVLDQGGNTLRVTPCTSRQLLKCNLWKGWERGQKWVVDADAGTPVTLRYDVALEHDPAEWPAGLDSAAFRTDWGVFFTGRALFVMNGRIRSPFVAANLAWTEGVLVPREDSRQAVQVTFDLPEGWRASTPWLPTAENSFVADDLIALSESMLMLGTQDTLKTEQGGTAITLALGGSSVVAESERLQQAFRETQAYYTAVLGGPPKTARENPLKRAIVVNSGTTTDGEVIGSNISLTFTERQPVFGVSTVETPQGSRAVTPVQTVFHEFFHLWNGVTFASEAEAEWFKEGVTDYYALRAARHLGYLDRETYVTLLGDAYRRHVATRAVNEVPLTEAGKDEFGQQELLYPGGLLVGFCLDLIIRSETGNVRSLDDLMKRVYAEYGASGRALSTAEVQTLAEALSGTDLGGFFSTYVRGSEVIPLPKYLRLAGIDATFENGRLGVVEDDSGALAVAVRSSLF